MIVEKQKESEVLVEGDSQDSIEMSLDLDSAQFLMQMLSKNLYSDAIGSTVRELASNALDSHRRAGVDSPIIVSLKPSQSQYEFSVEDFGLGLDDVEVNEIISKYGKSTKRDDDVELGMYGLGFKSPLAYTSSFYFIARKNGIERKYMMYEGEDVNTIDLLHVKKTSEQNGVKVVVPVRSSDKDQFVNKIKGQLAYFESVYFDVSVAQYSWGTSLITISNDFSIHRYDDFQTSELCSDTFMHICLDNVYYPIDFEKLGIPMMKIPIGLRFQLGDGLFPTPNRETIRYTTEAKAAIIQKIKKVADYFMELYNSTISDSDDIIAIYNYYKNRDKFYTLNGEAYNITELIKYSKIPMKSPKFRDVELINLSRICGNSHWLTDEYQIQYRIDRGRISEFKGWTRSLSIENVIESTIYVYVDRLGGVKKDYVRHLSSTTPRHGWRGDFIVRKSKPYGLKEYSAILGLKSIPKSKWRQTIAEFQKVQSSLTKRLIDIDTIEIPKDWIESRKKIKIKSQSTKIVNGKRKLKLKGEIIGKQGEDLERYYQGKNCKFVPHTIAIEKICIQPYLYVYSHHDKYEELDKLYGIMGKQKMKVFTFSDRELRIIKDADIHNLITFEEFMKGYNKPFRRMVTAYLIRSLISNYKNVFNLKHRLKSITTPFYEKLEVLEKYADKHHVCNNETGKAMLDVAIEYNLFDENIYWIYLDVQKTLNRLSFMDPLMSKMTSWKEDDGMKSIMVDMLKYHKFRINYTMYKCKNENNN